MAESLADHGLEFEYEKRKIAYTVPAKKRNYVTDFTFPSSGVTLEVKGKLDRLAREKIMAIKASNPDLDLRLLFMRNNKLSKTSRMRYTDWAEKHNIPCAVGTIPMEWVYDIKT